MRPNPNHRWLAIGGGFNGMCPSRQFDRAICHSNAIECANHGARLFRLQEASQPFAIGARPIRPCNVGPKVADTLLIVAQIAFKFEHHQNIRKLRACCVFLTSDLGSSKS